MDHFEELWFQQEEATSIPPE